METQEPVKATAAPRPSRLATASLLLGICAALSCLLLHILVKRDAVTDILLVAIGSATLALFLGVVAFIRIQISSGRVAGKGRAIIGLITGAMCIAVSFSPAIIPPVRHPETPKAATEAKCLGLAVQYYQIEYGKFPGQDSTNSDHLYSGAEGRLLLATLRGSNFVWNGKPSNPRNIVFLSISERSIVTTNSGGTAQVGELADPWGNRYEIVADWNGDGKIDAPLADGDAVPHRGVAVWSYGPKGKTVANSRDHTHIRSWR
jgi:hypothetical protein